MKERVKTMTFHNITEFLRGQASKIFTSIAENDDTAIVLKNGKPIVTVISFQRYERLMESGIDIFNY